ncbi:MAG: hypothetical protein WBM78_23940 [Desulfobacterales bacterium]|jgi:hypothetical protein
MKNKAKIRTIAIGFSLIAISFVTDGWFFDELVIREAEARVGRPMTPVSVAGVARRTTRRTIRRSTIYAATLPRGCTTVVIEGATLHQCGGTYYQPYNNQYVVVYVD